MRNISKFFIGALVLFLGFLVTDSMEFLMMSIVCTGGIGLVVYIPLSYVIGLILDELIFKRFRKPDETGQPAKIISINEQVSLTNNQKALINYIKESRDRGMTDEQISTALRDNGWSDEDIRSSYDLIAKYT